MSSFEVMALNPATPQLRAPGAGDVYSAPRNIYSPAIIDLAGLTGSLQFQLDASGLVFQQSAGLNYNRICRSATSSYYLSVVDGTGTLGNHGIEAGIFRLVGRTVGNLPNAVLAQAGAKCFVTDSTQTMTAGIGAVVVGGGANAVPVFYDGTNWIIG